MKKGTALVGLIILSIFLVLVILPVTADVPIQNYIIDGDSVYINNSKIFINATPHTITDSGRVELEFTSKIFSGEIDFYAGFNITQVKPYQVEYYNPRNVTTLLTAYVNNVINFTTTDEDCDSGFEYNTLKRKVFYNSSGIITQQVFCFDTFDNQTNNYRLYYDYNHIENWKEISNKFDSINYDYNDKNKWYYVKNFSVQANQTYKIRIAYNVPRKPGSFSPIEIDTKYDFCFKPSSLTLNESIQQNKLFCLDPWINSTGDLQSGLDYLSENLVFGFNFNNTGDGNLTDVITGTYNGTLMDSDYNWVPGIIGDGFNHSGADNNWFNVSVGNFLINNTIMISAWFKTTQLSGNNPFIIGKMEGAPNYLGKALGLVNGKVFFHSGAGFAPGQTTATAASNDNDWHHAVGCYNGSTGFIYLDGVLNNTRVTPNEMKDTLPRWKIGENYDSSNIEFIGTTDEVYVWNSSAICNASTVADLYNNGIGISYGSAAPPSTLILTINSPSNITYNVSNIIFNVTGDTTLDYCNFNVGDSNYTMTNLTTDTYNYTNSSMPDAQYTTIFWCNDSSGTANTTSIVFSIDATAPKINYTSPTPSSGTNQTFNSLYVNVTWNETNPGNLSFRLHNSTGEYNVTARTVNWTNFTGLPDGAYYFNVTFNDTLGNSNTTDTRNIIIDTLNPNVSLVSPANNTVTTNLSINFTVLMNDSGGIKNATLYIYNSTGDLYNSTVISFIAGTTTKTLGIVVTLINDVYTWFFIVFDWVEQSTTTGNFTLVINPKVGIDMIYPVTDINTLQNNLFNIIVNVSCNSGNCGTVNASLYYLAPSLTNITDYLNDSSLNATLWDNATVAGSGGGGSAKLFETSYLHLNATTDIVQCPGGATKESYSYIISTYNYSLLNLTNFSIGVINNSFTSGVNTYESQSIMLCNSSNANPGYAGNCNGLVIYKTGNASGSAYTDGYYNNGTISFSINNTDSNVSEYIDGVYQRSFNTSSIGNDIKIQFLTQAQSCSGSQAGFASRWNIENFTLHGYVQQNTSRTLISITPGTIPFYTNDTNPLTTSSLNEGDFDLITFWVNATGAVSSSYTLFTTVNRTTQLNISNSSSTGAVTIVDSPTLTINSPSNITYNVSNIIFNVTGDTTLDYCNFNVGDSNYTMTNLTTDTYNYTNSSMPDAQYTTIFWCNDSGSNMGTASRTFIVDTNSPQLNYTDPTPTNSTNQTFNSIYVNTTWTELNPDTLLFRLHDSSSEYNVTFYSINGNSNITISSSDTITNSTPNISALANADDNDWTTYATITQIGGNIIENYTIGSNYNTVTWIIEVEGRSAGCGDTINGLVYNYTSDQYELLQTISYVAPSGSRNISIATDYISPVYQISTMVNYSATTCGSDSARYVEGSMMYNVTGVGNISQNYTNFTNLPDGIYYFNVTLNDTAGNSNTTETRKVIVDTLNPNVSLVSPANNTNMTNQSANFTALMNDSGGIKNATLYIYNSTGDLYNSTVISFVAGTTTKTLGIVVTLINGVYTWFYTIFDWVDQSTTTGNFTLTVDNITPEINYSTGTENNYVNLSQSFIFVNTTWNETNPSAVLFRLHNTTGEVNVTSNTSPSGGNTSFNWTGLRDEIYTYNVTINDTAGNNATTLTKTITLDNANPLMNVSSPINITYSSNITNFTLNINDTSPIILCKFTLNSWTTNYTMDINQSSGTAIANYTNSSMIDGHHTAEFWCNDSVNNINNTENVEFTIDSSSPILNITFPNTQVNYHRNSTNLTFNWSYIESNPSTCFLDYTGSNFSVNCTDNSSIYAPVNITDYSNRNVTLWMNDTFGNSQSFTRNWTYKFFEINTSYDSFSYEGDYQTYVLNMTTDNASRIDLAYLIYNDTSYLATKGGSGTNVTFTRSINVPMAGAANKTLYWNVIYGDSSSNISINSTYTYNQSIVPINLVRCNTSVTFPYYNFTFNDEVNTSLSISAATNLATFEYYLNNSAFNETYSHNNATGNPSYGYCFTPPNRTLYISSVDYEYSATNYPLRKWDNTSITIPANYTINKTLWLLSTLDGQYVTFTVADTGGTALNGSEISITRVIGGNTVEVGQDTTDAVGSATFFLYPAASHTVSITRVNCTGAIFSVVPVQTSYAITLNCLSGATIGGNTNIEGVRYSRSPFVGGTTASGNVTFDYYAVSLLYDIIKAKFELYYSNGTLIASNETYVPTTYCNATECYMRLTLNVSAGDDIKARYYLAVNNTDTGEIGYILLEGDAHWRFITTIASDVGTIKKVFTNLRDLFTAWRPVGQDPISGWNFTLLSCEGYINETSCNLGGCAWDNSSANTYGTCFDFNHLNRLEYSRIVFIFLFMAILLTVFGRLTGYDAQNPGAFLILITGLIAIGTFANGITGPGFFYYNQLTPVPFLNNTMLFITVGFFTLGYYLSLTRRYT